jgi:hypothetical protein
MLISQDLLHAQVLLLVIYEFEKRYIILMPPALDIRLISLNSVPLRIACRSIEGGGGVWVDYCVFVEEECNGRRVLSATFVIAQWWDTGWLAGRPGFDSRQVQEIFLYSTAFRPALRPTQLSIQWVPAALFPGVKWPECEADYSPPCSIKVKDGGIISLLPHTSSWYAA